MAITYHAGRRIQATQVDFDGTPAVSGGWKELGRTTLGSGADEITVSSLANKRYYMFLTDALGSGDFNCQYRLGNSTVDTGSNYASRNSTDGVADVTAINQTFMKEGLGGAEPRFSMGYIANLSTKEKLMTRQMCYRNPTGSGNAPRRGEGVDKWTNTSNALDILQAYNDTGGAGGFSTNAEMVVLGWDEADTHTTNFWEELASVTATGSTTSFNSGTFTAKKYLWVQGYFNSDASYTPHIRVGNSTIDTGANYAGRRSYNGGADVTAISQTEIAPYSATSSKPNFFNMFIVNNAGSEKLAIVNNINQIGTGAGSAPSRRETVFKWANTSDQIDIIEFLASSGNIADTGIMKVWGHD